MGFPASGAEALYRNDITQVSKYLNLRHKSSYLIFNVSERKYDTAFFSGQVVDMGFPDHHAPPLDVLWTICHSMHSWLQSSENNVVVVHCRAGKGRTGVVIAGYLLFSGVCQSAEEASP